VGVLALAVAAGCASPFGPRYEYAEQLYLRVDGGATVIIDTSLAALVALRGLPIDPTPSARVDRDGIRRLFAEAGCSDVRVGQPWVRDRRHFVQVRVETRDVRTLSSCGPLSWSVYKFEKDAGGIHYEQLIGAPAPRDPGKVNWKGDEIVGFKLHLPSKIMFHNVKRLADGLDGSIDRGNILSYEQRLTDRRAGTPMHIDVRMGGQSILFQTLWLFGGAFAAALVVLTTIIWITMRRARKRKPLGA
jgi:hypothetical protein